MVRKTIDYIQKEIKLKMNKSLLPGEKILLYNHVNSLKKRLFIF